jgi:hypothetical protein
METLLDLLLARYERPEAMSFLQDLGARERAKGVLAADLVSAGMPPDMLATPEGDNLFVAVLALRLKFPESEAREKVALNIAMREQRRRPA